MRECTRLLEFIFSPPSSRLKPGEHVCYMLFTYRRRDRRTTESCAAGARCVDTRGQPPAEILITIRGCHAEPCTLHLNVSRGERQEFEQDLRTKLQRAFARHEARADPPI